MNIRYFIASVFISLGILVVTFAFSPLPAMAAKPPHPLKNITYPTGTFCMQVTFTDEQGVPDLQEPGPIVGTTMTIKYTSERVGSIYVWSGIQVDVPSGMPPQYSSGITQVDGNTFITVMHATGFWLPQVTGADTDTTYPYTLTGQGTATYPAGSSTLLGNVWLIMTPLTVEQPLPGTLTDNPTWATNYSIVYMEGTTVQVPCP